MRIAVTGLHGQVVESLRECAANDRHLVVLPVGRPALELAQPASVLPAIRDQAPDIVVSAAAYTAVDKAEVDQEMAFKVNRDGARAVAEASAALDVPVVHLSTDYVFSGSKPSPYVESDPVSPLGVYGKSKLAGEEAVRRANPRHVILRTAWVYSPFGNNFVKTMLRLARDRDTIRVVDDQTGNPTSAADIAEGILRVCQRIAADPGIAGTFHMTAAGEATWCAFAREIFAQSQRLRGPAATVEPITTADYPTLAARPANSRLDCSAFRQVFGATLPDWKRSLQVCVQRLTT